MNSADYILISENVLNGLNIAIECAISFEHITGKQMNITSIVGEVTASHKLNLKLVVNDINAGFDAVDEAGQRVQIKTRRDLGERTAQTGKLLDKNWQVPFDYALLVLLNKDYTLKSIAKISASTIQAHFERINAKRKSEGRSPRKTMSISQFESLARKENIAMTG